MARRVGAYRQSVSRWAQELKTRGPSGLKRAGRAGRKPRLSAENLEWIERALKRGPQAFGYSTELWTARWVRDVIARQSSPTDAATPHAGDGILETSEAL